MQEIGISRKSEKNRESEEVGNPIQQDIRKKQELSKSRISENVGNLKRRKSEKVRNQLKQDNKKSRK